MMKYLFTILLLNAVIISTANARNCAQAVHNKHCSASSGNSGSQSQTTTLTGAVGQTPDPAQVNSHLGSGSPAQNQVVNVYPLPPTVITGTSLVTLQTLTAKPHTFTGQNVQVHPLPPTVITGTSLVTLQTLTAKPHTFTGQNVQVNPVPTPIITGTSAGPLQPIITAPPKTFTGQAQQVYPIATPILIGNAAVPVKPAMNVPTVQTMQTPTALPYKVPKTVVPPSQTSVEPPKGSPPAVVGSTPLVQVVPVRPAMNVPTVQTMQTPTALPYKVPLFLPPSQTSVTPNIGNPPPIDHNPAPSQIPVAPNIGNPSAVVGSTPLVQVEPVRPAMNVPTVKTMQTPTALPYKVPKTVVPPSQTSVAPNIGNPSAVVGSTPLVQVYPVPTPILIGQAVPVIPVMALPPKSNTAVPLPQSGNKLPTPVLITHVASTNLHPDILLHQMSHGSTDLKSLEPYIKDLPVDVYTNKSVHKTMYKRSASANYKGFHLTVVGIKEQAFADTTPLPVALNSDDIIFNFSFASAEIHKDQLSQVDKIIEKHSKNGKRIILMGETDGFGSESYNKHLAVLRAQNIINAIKERGVKVDDIEIRILVRCCRKDHPNKETLAETSAQRITWVHFQ